MTQRLPIRESAIVAASFCAALVLVLTSTRPIDAASQAAAAKTSLTDLKSVEDLKRLFNADVGKTRLVLLLSPT